MARRRNTNKRNNSNQSNSLWWILAAVVGLCGFGFLVYKLAFSDSGSYKFSRADLDKYVEITHKQNSLRDGASVYVDMSDGMNSAYATEDSKVILQSIINKLAANNNVNFYGLANEQITPIEMGHTELYNYMLNPKSYNMQKAPIEKTLTQIVNNRQPSLLMTDFEEYKGSVIEQAAYAKKYFIDWLEKGYNITFYKWNFVERGKSKLMFLAVFDDNENRLNSLVETAVKGSGIKKYVLAGKEFAYPAKTAYRSLKQGGSYHNAKGSDIVTAVLENGGAEDYICYAKPKTSKSSGKCVALEYNLESYAEYYPLGVDWADAIKNAKMMQEEGVSKTDLYAHLFGKLYVNFGAQDGFNIKNVGVVVRDMQSTMEAVCLGGDSISAKQIKGIKKPQIDMAFVAGMQEVKELKSWNEIYVDFDENFDGSFVGGTPTSNLIRADILISEATPDIDKAISFFSWDGNPSLANSVKEALTAETSNPQGRTLVSYYIKTIVE